MFFLRNMDVPKILINSCLFVLELVNSLNQFRFPFFGFKSKIITNFGLLQLVWLDVSDYVNFDQILKILD